MNIEKQSRLCGDDWGLVCPAKPIPPRHEYTTTWIDVLAFVAIIAFVIGGLFL